MENIPVDHVLEVEEPVVYGKCIKCKGRKATREDQLCDNCRYLATIEGILKSRKTT